MCCEIMAVAERPIVELLHADVGHNIQLATKEREKQRREQHNRQDKTGGKHEATPKHVIPHFHEQRATGLIPTEIRLVNNPLHGLEEQDLPLLLLHAVAERGVVFHVMVEFVQLTLLHKPGIIILLVLQQTVRRM